MIMIDTQSEYQKLLDHGKIAPFKAAMRHAAKRTFAFPNSRGVFVEDKLLHSHGGVWEYCKEGRAKFCKTTEGLGNKNWIAEWMYMHDPKGGSRYDLMAISAIMCAANDNAAQGALPVVCTDEVAADNDEWFTDTARANDFGEGFVTGCRLAGMALIQGESPAYRYLLQPTPPVKHAPALSVTVTGVIAPVSRMVTGEKIAPKDVLIGAASSGLGENGISLVIKRGLELQDSFFTKFPGTSLTLGYEALRPSYCYVPMVEECQNQEIDVHAFQPATGNGVGKVAFDPRSYTYVIERWLDVPLIFQYLRELGVPILDCLKTFNWGVGYWIIVAPQDADAALKTIHRCGFKANVLGYIKEGDRKVVFCPEGDLDVPAPTDD